MDNATETGKSNDELADLLAGRGLCADRAELIRALDTVGYFRLKSYLVPFMKRGTREFKDGAKFADAWAIYTADRRLRVLTFEALSRIEVAIRALVVREHVAVNADPFAYTVQENMPGLQAEGYATLLKKLGTDKPIWEALDEAEFGALTLYYRGLPSSVKQKIANTFHLPMGVIDGILNGIRKARNVCAHHGRFWNCHFEPMISERLGFEPEAEKLIECCRKQVSANRTSTFTLLSLIAYYIRIVRPESSWCRRCHAFLKDLPRFMLNGMGVPEDWEDLALWKDD